MVGQGIVDGVVPPDQDLTAVGLDDVLEGAVGDGLGDDTGACPHQHHVLMDQGRDLVGVVGQEGIAVLGGDGDEVTDPVVGLHEAGLEVGEELAVSLGVKSGDVV